MTKFTDTDIKKSQVFGDEFGVMIALKKFANH